ncbi:hypothetical protein K435DRAFT_808358 [Dendrothele bispora CBS 962.96]|uniref:Secreted protein n=1 Tax=Dendrothele bispora (strain CBS 962.96) TaxID=1314807 RepID=A0A4S8L242_DENBC|nr:hypothetical protein K435DRAFT_808358 [Dendrothele bispora CBS 962.96]
MLLLLSLFLLPSLLLLRLLLLPTFAKCVKRTTQPIATGTSATLTTRPPKTVELLLVTSRGDAWLEFRVTFFQLSPNSSEPPYGYDNTNLAKMWKRAETLRIR